MDSKIAGVANVDVTLLCDRNAKGAEKPEPALCIDTGIFRIGGYATVNKAATTAQEGHGINRILRVVKLDAARDRTLKEAAAAYQHGGQEPQQQYGRSSCH